MRGERPCYFLSHSGYDKFIAICVARLLAKRELDFWLDLSHAEDNNAIFDGIRRASMFVIVASENYESSQWCQRELIVALSQGKTIRCLRIQRPPTSDMYYKQYGGTTTRPTSKNVDPKREICEFFRKFVKRPLTAKEKIWLGRLLVQRKGWLCCRFRDRENNWLDSLSADEIMDFIYGEEVQILHTETSFGFAKPAVVLLFFFFLLCIPAYWFSRCPVPEQNWNTAPQSPMPNAATSFVDNRTIAVYICDDKEDAMQQRKIHNLFGYFKENLIIATADTGTKANWIVPEDQVFSPKILDPWFKCNHACQGMERALASLIQLADSREYDNAWVITQEMYWKDFDDLRQMFEHYQGDSTDFVHQNESMEKGPYWKGPEMDGFNFKYLRSPLVQPTAQMLAPYYTGMFHFYRISRDMVLRLQDWKFRNKGSWTFYEPLLATLSVQASGLTTKSYINEKNRHKFCFRYRPCFQKEEIDGTTDCPRGNVFHPVFKDFGACSA